MSERPPIPAQSSSFRQVSPHTFGAVPVEGRLEDYQRALQERFPEERVEIEVVDMSAERGRPHAEARLATNSDKYTPDELQLMGSAVLTRFTAMMHAERGRG